MGKHTMRNIWMTSLVVLAAGCGIESKAWDKNHDGLVMQCEGLDRVFCSLTPGCEAREVACLAVCQDDGKGGCTNPCPNDFQCVPKAPVACSTLNAQQCSADPRCISDSVVCGAVCRDDGKGGCLPCGGSVCRDRDPTPSCALVPLNSCASIPACEVRIETVCTATGHDLPLNGNSNEPTAGCGGGGSCISTEVCVNKPVQTCETTGVASCTANPSCELANGPVCEVACSPNAPCPPCATPAVRCVTREALSCESRSLVECTSKAGCMVEAYACPAICEDDGKGGCKPCNAPPSHCVSLPFPGQPEALPPTK